MDNTEENHDRSDETRTLQLSTGKDAGVANQVASHYNKLEERGVVHRRESRIYYLRNLNNWIKSMLIQDFVTKLERNDKRDLKVLDLGCGKGGDLLKWQKSRVKHVVCMDIAETSIEQCEERYKKMEGRGSNIFSGEFYTVDCTKSRTRDFLKDPEMQFDLVSCQFAFHYCFESYQQAKCMLRNATENLKIGGFFIGTTPCAYEIMSRLQKCGGSTFGNSVYSITFDPDTVNSPPLFGAQYNFHLEGVVDCPEFLVYLPVLERLAEKFGLILVSKERFGNYFHKKRKCGEKEVRLLSRMYGLEPYPTDNLVADRSQYEFAQNELNDEKTMVGTLSKDEWEALNIYTVFAFRKISEADPSFL